MGGGGWGEGWEIRQGGGGGGGWPETFLAHLSTCEGRPFVFRFSVSLLTNGTKYSLTPVEERP